MNAVLLQSIDLTAMSEGTALGVVGILALLLWAAVQFRNPAAGVMWGITVLVMLMTSVYGLADEILWLAMMATTTLVIVGAGARVMAGRDP